MNDSKSYTTSETTSACKSGVSLSFTSSSNNKEVVSSSVVAAGGALGSGCVNNSVSDNSDSVRPSNRTRRER